MAPYLKAVYWGLKIGVAGAKFAGISIPDISQFVPSSLRNIEGSIVSAISAAGVSLPNLDSAAQSFLKENDSALREAVEQEKVGTGSFRPSARKGDALAAVRQLFDFNDQNFGIWQN